MNTIHIPSLPIKANVCDQMLREVRRTDDWSMAHVVMNPGAASLLHTHHKMAEVYVITKGNGVFDFLTGGTAFRVCAGTVIYIPAGKGHRLLNDGVTSLEHFVLASPAFDSADVTVLEYQGPCMAVPIPWLIPFPVESIDGVKIFPYDVQEVGMSFAFGSVPERKARVHYHKKITEFIYVIEGRGKIVLNDVAFSIREGDWIEISPQTQHAMINEHSQHMTVLCVCSPAFRMDDVYYPTQ